MKKPLKTFIINRKRWARAGINGSSMLLNEQKAMCCLGFLSKKLGTPTGVLRNCASPDDIDIYYEGKSPDEVYRRFKGLVKKSGVYRNTKTTNSLMNENDDTSIDEATRERKITSLFHRIGWHPKFVG